MKESSMDKREWKPGDVAMRVSRVSGSSVVIRVSGCDRDSSWAADPHWHMTIDGTGHCGSGNAEPTITYRPLVVIDPEDREQATRLAAARRDAWDGPDVHTQVSAMQAALREFANPTPAKPDEPLGLGAVVEDELDRVWVRADNEEPEWRTSGDGLWVSWPEIVAPRVLSEGVTP